MAFLVTNFQLNLCYLMDLFDKSSELYEQLLD
jgi:hypothetical protein